MASFKDLELSGQLHYCVTARMKQNKKFYARHRDLDSIIYIVLQEGWHSWNCMSVPRELLRLSVLTSNEISVMQVGDISLVLSLRH